MSHVRLTNQIARATEENRMLAKVKQYQQMAAQKYDVIALANHVR